MFGTESSCCVLSAWKQTLKSLLSLVGLLLFAYCLITSVSMLLHTHTSVYWFIGGATRKNIGWAIVHPVAPPPSWLTFITV